MLKILTPYILSFIPIFVAVNALGNIPLYLSLSEGMEPKARHRVAINSIIIAVTMIRNGIVGNIISMIKK